MSGIIGQILKNGAVEVSEQAAQLSNREFGALLKQMKVAIKDPAQDVTEFSAKHGLKLVDGKNLTLLQRVSMRVRFALGKLLNTIKGFFGKKAAPTATEASAATQQTGSQGASKAAADGVKDAAADSVAPMAAGAAPVTVAVKDVAVAAGDDATKAGANTVADAAQDVTAQAADDAGKVGKAVSDDVGAASSDIAQAFEAKLRTFATQAKTRNIQLLADEAELNARVAAQKLRMAQETPGSEAAKVAQKALDEQMQQLAGLNAQISGNSHIIQFVSANGQATKGYQNFCKEALGPDDFAKFTRLESRLSTPETVQAIKAGRAQWSDDLKRQVDDHTALQERIEQFANRNPKSVQTIEDLFTQPQTHMERLKELAQNNPEVKTWYDEIQQATDKLVDDAFIFYRK